MIERTVSEVAPSTVVTPTRIEPADEVEFNGFGPLPPELWPNVDHLITEDDTPVDNLYSGMQMRLLPTSAYDGWSGPGPGRSFVAMANVGLYYAIDGDPLVPDVLLALDVTLPKNIWEKRHRTYMIWQFGKPPDVVIEIVSNKVGGEDSWKKDRYAQIGVAYYVIYDPMRYLSKQVLRVYELRSRHYVLLKKPWMADVGLGLTLWHGVFERREDTWLRWCDREGNILPTGAERAEQEHQRAEQEHQRAEQLAAQLRALGVDPDV
jgi:Uma2 family endonuclease